MLWNARIAASSCGEVKTYCSFVWPWSSHFYLYYTLTSPKRRGSQQDTFSRVRFAHPAVMPSKEIRRLGCELALRDVMQPGVVKVDVLRCGLRGQTPAHEYWTQVLYPITVDPELPYRICGIESTYSYPVKMRYFTSFLNIRWRG